MINMFISFYSHFYSVKLNFVELRVYIFMSCLHQLCNSVLTVLIYVWSHKSLLTSWSCMWSLVRTLCISSRYNVYESMGTLCMLQWLRSGSILLYQKLA